MGFNSGFKGLKLGKHTLEHAAYLFRKPTAFRFSMEIV